MTSLPDTLVRFGTDLEHAIGREQAVRRRKRHRRRVAALAAAAVVVIVGTASAFTTVREFFVDADPFPQGRVSRTVDGVHFSFSVPKKTSGHGLWESGPDVTVGGKIRTGSLLISRSTVGGQRAEAVIFWTAFPQGGQAAPCASLLRRDFGRSTGDLAAAMAKAPGTKVLKGPRRVTIGGRPAWHLALSVRKDLGCDPGFFFTWRAEMWGAFWLETYVGDTIRVWIVDVDGKRLVFEAETRQPDSHGWPKAIQVTRADVRKVEAEIAKIVGSIRFDSS